MYKNDSEIKLKILQLDYEGKSIEDIEFETGVSRAVVAQILRNNRIDYFVQQAPLKLLSQLRYRAGAETAKIVRELGVRIEIAREVNSPEFRALITQRKLIENEKLNVPAKSQREADWRCPECHGVSKQTVGAEPVCPYEHSKKRKAY